MSKRSICILGGTGFVGGHLVARLARDGHNLKVLTRSQNRNRDLLVLPTVTLLETDIHNPAALEHAFNDCDTVINLVGILNEKGNDGSGFHRMHVKLTESVIEAAKKAGVRRLLHMSALKADPEGPSHYQRTKGEAEALVREAQDPNFNTTIFQPSVIFGPDDAFINRFAGLLKMPNYFFLLPSPNTRFAPVYIGNVVDAFAKSLGLRRTWGKTYQLCGPKVYSLREILVFIRKTLGVKRRIVGLSSGVSRILARTMEFVPGKPLSIDNFNSMTVHSICDENGLKRLGITPVALESIVPRYLSRRSARDRLTAFRESAGRA